VYILVIIGSFVLFRPFGGLARFLLEKWPFA
jgi:hypothetical protein